MTQPRTAPYIWVTWLSKLLVGDDSCVWSSWFRAHFQDFRKGDGSSPDLVRWKMAHTRLLRQITDALRAGGHALTTEDQNLFRLTGKSGATLAGKPDLIATAPDGSVTVYDAKTGSKKASDAAQGDDLPVRVGARSPVPGQTPGGEAGLRRRHGGPGTRRFPGR